MTHTFPKKTRHFSLKVLLLFLLPAGLFSCGKKDFAQMIPADAALVVHSNLKAVAEEYGGMEQLGQTAAASGNPLLSALAGDPEESGIDFAEDVYLYATLNRDEPTFLFALSDESKFARKLEELNAQGVCGKIQQGNPFRWTAFPGKGLCAFADGFAVWVYAPLTPPENVLSRLRELQGLDEKDTFIAQEEWELLKSQPGNTRFFLSLETLPNTAAVATALGMPSHLSPEDLRLCGNISLEPGKASLEAEFYSGNTEVEDFLESRSLDEHALSGKYFSYLPDDLLACIALKIDGDGYSKINAVPDIGPALSTLTELSGIDAEPFLNSFSGDFLIGIQASGTQNPLPGVTCYAESADQGTREILKKALGKGWGFFGPVFKTVAPDNYVLELAPEMSLRLGTKGQDFYFTTAAGKPFETPARTLRDAGYDALRDGKLIAYLLFCPGILQEENGLIGEYLGENADLLSGIRAVEFAARPGRKIELNVYFRQ